MATPLVLPFPSLLTGERMAGPIHSNPKMKPLNHAALISLETYTCCIAMQQIMWEHHTLRTYCTIKKAWVDRLWCTPHCLFPFPFPSVTFFHVSFLFLQTFFFVYHLSSASFGCGGVGSAAASGDTRAYVRLLISLCNGFWKRGSAWLGLGHKPRLIGKRQREPCGDKMRGEEGMAMLLSQGGL